MEVSNLLNLLLAVFLGSTLGTLIATRLAFWLTERWIKDLLKDENFRQQVVEFLKGISDKYLGTYAVPKARELVSKYLGQRGSGDLSELVSLDEFLEE